MLKVGAGHRSTGPTLPTPMTSPQIKSFVAKAQIMHRPDGLAFFTLHFGIAGLTDADAELLATSAEIALAAEVALAVAASCAEIV